MADSKKIVVKVNCASLGLPPEPIKMQEPEMQWRYDRIAGAVAVLFGLIFAGVSFVKLHKTEPSIPTLENRTTPQLSPSSVSQKMTEAAIRQVVPAATESKQLSKTPKPAVKIEPSIKKTAAKSIKKQLKKSKFRSKQNAKNRQ